METVVLDQKKNLINWNLDLYSIIANSIPKNSDWMINRVNAGSYNQSKFEWLSVTYSKNFLPHSGWKLHISASLFNAEKILSVCLPVLLNYRFNFKITASIDFLAYINENVTTQEQRGKFITVYSHDDTTIVELAHELHLKTQHFTSPNIITDRHFSSNSNIYYRYGIFYPIFTQSLWGSLLAEIEHNGKKYVDSKNKNASIYSVVQDPFVKIRSPFSKKSKTHHFKSRQQDKILKEKGIIKSVVLYNSGDSFTALCLDIKNKRRCILKVAHHKSMQDIMGNDGKDRLRIEAEILKKLGNVAIAPQWYDSFYNEEDQYCLVMEDLIGIDLFRYLHMNMMTIQTLEVSNNELLDLSLKIAKAIKKLHDIGIIHADLKLSNLILLETKEIRIIDFNSAYDTSTDKIIFACGTKGYSTRNRDQGNLPTFSDDIYSYGAILYYLFSAINSDVFPLEVGQTETALSFLNPNTPSYIIDLIHFCLEGKYKIFTEIISHLEKRNYREVSVSDMRTSKTSYKTTNRDIYYEKLYYLVNVYLNLTYDENTKIHQMNPTLIGKNQYTDLRGSAGALIALVTVTLTDPNLEKYSEILLLLSQNLANEKLPYNPIPGLYVGESSKCLALLYTGLLLNNHTIIIQSEKHMERVNQLPLLSPDLFNGVAGRLRTNIIFFILTGKEIYRTQATIMVEFFFAQQAKVNDLIAWYNPTIQSTVENYELNREEIMFGYAHGIAGIADALIDYYTISENVEMKKKIQNMIGQITESLISHAVLEKGNKGLMWPGKPKEKPLPSYWCHGGAGIGLFICRAMRYCLISKNNSLIKKIIYPIKQYTLNGAPILCHGIVGSIESLLDIKLHNHTNLYHTLNIGETINVSESILALWLRTYINNGCVTSNFMFDFYGYLTGVPGIISVYSRLVLNELPNPLHVEFAKYLLTRIT